MAVEDNFGSRTGNQILDRLSAADYDLLRPHIHRVPMSLGQVLYEEWQPMAVVYFPISGVISATIVMLDGHIIEVANVGREGLSGVSAVFGLQPSVHKVFVQIGGEAMRMNVSDLRAAVRPGGSILDLMQRYFTTFLSQVSQSVACNGLHGIKQRCCRWLLMTLDRINGAEVPLTHEFLAVMLGVRRASVSEVLKSLQDDGLLYSVRGKIIIIDRPGMEAESCECYEKGEQDYHRVMP